jgi:hypothetical protein
MLDADNSPTGVALSGHLPRFKSTEAFCNATWDELVYLRAQSNVTPQIPRHPSVNATTSHHMFLHHLGVQRLFLRRQHPALRGIQGKVIAASRAQPPRPKPLLMSRFLN